MITWHNPEHGVWYTDLKGVGRYVVRRRGHSRVWGATFGERPTTFTGNTAQQVKAQVERAINAFEACRRRRFR